MMLYTTEMREYRDLEGKIKLPNYQRPLVWTRDQKSKFIEVISKGFPFGSILLYKYDDDREFSLIDGQQRYAALQEFAKSPELYFPIEDSPYIDELLRVSGAAEQSMDARDKLRIQFIGLVRELIKAKSNGADPEASLLAMQIADEFPYCRGDAEKMMAIADLQKKILGDLDNYVDLDNLRIPCVIFTGAKSALPEVFANVNLGGRKLTKYQVFAASWESSKIKLPDEPYSSAILTKTIDRYNRLTVDRGLEIEDYSPEQMLNDREVTLPELCHALGELIIETCRSCWPQNAVSSDDTIDTLGYNTLAIVFGVVPKEITDLPDRFARAGFEDSDGMIEALVGRIVDEYKEINGRFSNFLRIPGSSERYETSKTSSQLQFLSFFAALWRLHYGVVGSVNFEPLQGYRYKGYDETCRNLFPSFVYDMLMGQWKGSGDSKLGNFVNGNLNYKEPITKSKLENAMGNYLEESGATESINIDSIAKTLLAIFSNSRFNEYREKKYDYEHLIPRDTLNKRFDGKPAYKEFGIPGGSLGNIAFLDASFNRAKKAKTLADATNELYNFDGHREEVDKDAQRMANYDLLDGYPDKARAFIRNRANVLADRIIHFICG